MLQVAENIKDNWILRAVIIYAALLWIMARTGIWEPAWTRATVAGFLLLAFASGLLCLRIFSSLEDRNFLLARLTYTLGPCLFLLLIGAPLLEMLPGPAIARDIQFFLLVFLAIVWYQISVPFVRTWMRDSPDPEKLFRIERKLSYHVTLSEIMDEKPFISSRTYYAFVTGLLSFILVFAMAVLSEILGASVGMIGFIVSISITLASAAAMYPIHKRVSSYIRIDDITISSSTSVDLKLAAAETWRGLYDRSRPIVRYWYITLSALLLIFAVIIVYRVVLRFVWF